jgi:hypothetical protein
MTGEAMDLKEMFDAASDDFLHFEEIENPRHRLRDVCAFLMLDDLAPSANALDIVTAAEHDEIWLATSTRQLAQVATPEIVRDLVRCGLRYDEHNDALAFFV